MHAPVHAPLVLLLHHPRELMIQENHHDQQEIDHHVGNGNLPAVGEFLLHVQRVCTWVVSRRSHVVVNGMCPHGRIAQGACMALQGPIAHWQHACTQLMHGSDPRHALWPAPKSMTGLLPSCTWRPHLGQSIELRINSAGREPVIIPCAHGGRSGVSIMCTQRMACNASMLHGKGMTAHAMPNPAWTHHSIQAGCEPALLVLQLALVKPRFALQPEQHERVHGNTKLFSCVG
jgi:hypothetical protein